MKYGFITVAAAVPSVKVADTEYNVKQIEDFVAQAEGKGVEIIVFPELSITGYSCQDLFLQQLLIEQSEVAVMQLLDFTRKLDIPYITALLSFSMVLSLGWCRKHIFLITGNFMRSDGSLLQRICNLQI